MRWAMLCCTGAFVSLAGLSIAGCKLAQSQETKPLSENDLQEVRLVSECQVVTNGAQKAALVPLTTLWRVIK
jgi:hypothetical protein